MIIYHLDPTRLNDLLALPFDEQRVLLALLSLSASGELVGKERRLAHRAGLNGRTTQLREILTRLASRIDRDGKPIVTRDRFKGQPRLRITGLSGLIIGHSECCLSSPSSSTMDISRVHSAPPMSLEEIRDQKIADLRADYGQRLAELANAWVAYLADLQPDHVLPLSVQVRQYDAIAALAASYGTEAAIAALRAGLGKIKESGRYPEIYLEIVARRNFHARSTTSSPNASRRRRRVIAEAPLSEEDLF